MSTRPGLHRDIDLSSYPKRVRTAVYKIAKDFYVTRTFNPESIGNSRYWGILARPSSDFSVHLNADRELLVVFSDFKAFEIRTLEAFEAFYAQLEQKRVDKSIRFLVSSDESIERIIAHYLNQNPEYPIIIPTTFNDLSDEENSLLGSIRKNYLLRDLFGYQNPLREETFFFGRQDLVSTVLDLAKSGQSSSIFGLRKSGKTSTTYAIQRRAKSFSCTSVLIDCQNPTVHARKSDSLLQYVLTSIRSASGLKQTTKIQSNDAALVADEFSEDLRNILGQTKNSILLVFDEIENITPGTAASPHWNDGRDALLFWQCIRSFVQSESKGRVSVCLVGTSPRLLELPKISGVANPMYLFSPKRFISNFSFDETREMVERLSFYMGLQFKATQISKLQDRYGGHPFFIRQVCSQVHQSASFLRPIDVTDRLLEEAIERFEATLQIYLSDILSNLKENYLDEYEVLVSIAKGDTEDANEMFAEVPELLDHLIGYELIERRASDLEFRFQAVKQAILKLHAIAEEDRTAFISKSRNQLERAIRATLFHWSKYVSSTEWLEVLQKSLTIKRYENLQSTEPSLLFSNDSPLYFSDLMILLKNDRVLPYLNEKRSSIVRDMDIVNRHRIDAHAKAISDSDYEALKKSIAELNDEFLSS